VEDCEKLDAVGTAEKLKLEVVGDEEEFEPSSLPDVENPVFRLRRVPALQSTLEHTNGKIWMPKRSKGQAQVSHSTVSEGPKSVSREAVVLSKNLESAKPCMRQSPNSTIGTGQKRALKLFARASIITLASSNKESNRQEKPGVELSTPSAEVILRSGRIPKHTREFISSLGIQTCGRNRMWLLPEEEALLLKMKRTPEVKSALVFKRPFVTPSPKS